MEPFVTHHGLVAAMDRVNVDTDAIIPKQFLKRIERSGFGQFLFNDWRFNEDGSLNPEFELNQPELQGASILLARNNFGCGSSREHAPWALADYGFRAILAPSFADIFHNNCFKNGLLAIQLPEAIIDELFAKSRAGAFHLTVDLQEQVITAGAELRIPFSVDPYRRELLLQGLDDIGVTLQHAAAIQAFENQR